jgi:Flp pilus assembly protein CpaB
MRPRTFILLIVVLIVAAAAVVLFLIFGPGDLLSGGEEEQAAESAPQEEVQEPIQEEEPTPVPSPTPEVRFATVIVARTNLPVGERIRADLIEVETRPEDNVAVVAGVTFSDPDEVIGQIVKTAVSRGQEILKPMIALSPSDVAALGSDLSLYVDQGRVAVAFPINRFSGAAYALRPGDSVDALMSLNLLKVDREFQTKRPNVWERVFEPALLAGEAFLFPPTSEGRLELIPGINSIAVIGPGTGKEQIPRRVTQLGTQQMEVLWVGTWNDPRISLDQQFQADAKISPPESDVIGEDATSPEPTTDRPEDSPDVVILSLSAQDAVALKWALENGLNVDLALRAQGDDSVFATTSVSLPQIVEQGVLTIPEPGEFSPEPRIDELDPPSVPPVP